jgi:hypothetical protein
VKTLRREDHLDSTGLDTKRTEARTNPDRIRPAMFEMVPPP